MGKKKSKRKYNFSKAYKKNRMKRESGASYVNLPDGIPVFKEKGGKTYHLDFVPYIVKNTKKHPDGEDIVDDIWMKMPFRIHRNVGPEKKTLICPATFGKQCPICDERQAVFDDDKRDNKEASAFYPSPRHLYYVIPRKAKDYEEEVHVWNVSDFAFAEVLDFEIKTSGHMADEYDNYASPEGGFTLKIKFKDEPIGKNSTFPKAQRIDFIERDDIDEDVFEDLPPLEDCVTALSFKSMEATFYGMDDEDEDNTDNEDPEDDKEEEEKPKKSKSKKEKKSKPKKEKKLECPEDYDFGEDYDDNDECEDCDLRKECKKKNKELTKEEPEEEEEQEEEKPKKEKKTKKTTKKKSKKLECPHDYEFGNDDDFDMHDECEDCDIYNECEEKADE